MSAEMTIRMRCLLREKGTKNSCGFGRKGVECEINKGGSFKLPPLFYFFRKLLKAIKIIPQSITVAIIKTTKAPPVICIILPPP